MKKQITISVHNGTAVSRAHNMRNRKVTDKEPHIDKNGWYAVWHDEPLREAYRRIFGKAQEEYNLKQTRNDRRVVDYLSTVSKSAKQHPVYETIITLGNMEEHPSLTRVMRSSSRFMVNGKKITRTWLWLVRIFTQTKKGHRTFTLTTCLWRMAIKKAWPFKMGW